MENKNLNSNDLIVSLGSEDFRQYFRNNILPHLEPIEQQRVQLKAELNKKQKRTLGIVVSVFMVSAFPVFCFQLLIFIISKNALGFWLFIVHGLTVCIVLATMAWAWIWIYGNVRGKKEFKELTGKKILPLLLSYWGTFKYCNRPTYVGREAFELLSNLQLYSMYESIEVDDCIEGEYNGLKLKITELDVTYTTSSGRSSSTVHVFNGLMLEVDMNKKFTSHTIIKPDKRCTGLDGRFKRVNLEDPEFEKMFDVYSTDQIDSRYLLTTAFMRRLLEFRIASGKYIEVVFFRERAFFFINYFEDKFELPLNESILEMKHYQNILLDLARILRIVDALKLEQKIGM